MRRRSDIRFLLADVRLQASGDIAPREEDAPAAAETLQPDVGPESNDDPVRASARMRFAQAQHILHLQLGQHVRPRSSGRALYHPPRWYNSAPMLGVSAATLLTRAITLVIAFTVHEFSHAWTATSLGDDTPRANGRLTLNPLAHLDPLGSLLLLISGFGWARPVPVDPYALQRRTPAGMMLVSAAGRFSNLILAILAALPIQLGLASLAAMGVRASWLPSPVEFLAEFIFINLILFFFNLVPLAPLDGEKVLGYFLPPSGQEALLRLQPYGPMILLGVLFLGPRLGLDIFHWIVGVPALTVFNLLVS